MLGSSGERITESMSIRIPPTMSAVGGFSAINSKTASTI